MVVFRDMQARDIQPTAALVHHIWHELYAPFMPKAFSEKSRSPAACTERQESLFKDCTASPAEHKALVAVDEKDGVLGYCHLKKYAPSTYGAGWEMFDVDGYDAELVRLYLWPQACRKGTGRKMIMALLPWMRANAFRSCFAWAFDGNPAGPAFFARYGAKAVKKINCDYSGKMLPLTVHAWDDFAGAFGSGA